MQLQNFQQETCWSVFVNGFEANVFSIKWFQYVMCRDERGFVYSQSLTI